MFYKNICIIGCGGFIGSHLTGMLLNSGVSVVGIDIVDTKIREYLGCRNFKFYNLDIGEMDDIKKCIKDSDIVISLASICNPSLYNKKPLSVINSNFISQIGIIEECAKTNKWYVCCSTSEVYGRNNPDSEFSEDSTPFVLGPVQAQRWSYACAKQLLERVIYAYGFERNLKFTILRPFNFIGTKMDFLPGLNGEGIPRVLACFLSALIQNKPLQLVNGGHSKRVFTDINDVLYFFELLLTNPERSYNQIYNVGNPNNEISIRDFASLMVNRYQKITGANKKCEIVSISSKDFYGEGYEDSENRMPNITKAINILGWTPKISLEDSIEKIMEFYVKIKDYENYI